MSAPAPEISVVLPTYNRLAALRTNFPALQALSGVTEIVVVVDGSTDGTLEWLRGLADPRVQVVTQDQRGSPAARNRGVAEARGEWLLMTEDDCHLPREFARTLLRVAHRHDAQIVGAPWLQIDSLAEADAALERARARGVPRIGLTTHPTVFPQDDLETPFLNGIVLVRRDVFGALAYEEHLGGNAWREETSMFLHAVQAGFRCVLTPATAAFQLGQWDGGQRRPRLSYEAWAIRNNWRFLRTHGQALERLGEIRSPLRAQVAFVTGRLLSVARGFAGERWRRASRWRELRRGARPLR